MNYTTVSIENETTITRSWQKIKGSLRSLYRKQNDHYTLLAEDKKITPQSV